VPGTTRAGAWMLPEALFPYHQSPVAMNEYFLQYLWQYALIYFHQLYTTDGQMVTVLDRGRRNDGAGPDFLDARVKIGRTLWSGHIEIHTRSSLWRQHGHHRDDKYRNVILHVVYEDDWQDNDSQIPVVEIRDKFPGDYLEIYTALMGQPYTVLCSAHLPQVPAIIVEKLKETVMAERWQQKFRLLTREWTPNRQDWKPLAYLVFARAFGFKVNQEAFETLVQQTPLSVLEKHKDNLFQLEALLFGQAGLIPEGFQDAYTRSLEKEYHFLRRKYSLVPMEAGHWNFARLRPNNFPTIRIAQFAHFLFQVQCDFGSLLMPDRYIKDWLQALSVQTSPYFREHYRLSDQSLHRSEKKLGTSGIYHLIINAIAPLRFWYETTFSPHKENAFEAAFDILLRLPAEKNAVTRMWPLKINNAFDSQSVIQLVTHKCTDKKCLECAVGDFILRKQ